MQDSITRVNNTELRILQLTKLEIMKEIDQFCKAHNIHYSLYANTLLGAVYHGGFIPDDDELDICMKRWEYNRFVRIWKKEGPEGYIIQNKDLDPQYTQTNTRIRKEKTCYFQNECGRDYLHTDGFVDVFPIDRIPEGSIRKKKYYYDALLYQVYTRGTVPQISGRVTKGVLTVLIKNSSKEVCRKRRLNHFRRMMRFNSDIRLPMIGTETQKTLKMPLPADLMDELTEISFEDERFSCMKKYKDYLAVRFGNSCELLSREEVKS